MDKTETTDVCLAHQRLSTQSPIYLAAKRQRPHEAEPFICKLSLESAVDYVGFLLSNHRDFSAGARISLDMVVSQILDTKELVKPNSRWPVDRKLLVQWLKLSLTVANVPGKRASSRAGPLCRVILRLLDAVGDGDHLFHCFHSVLPHLLGRGDEFSSDEAKFLSDVLIFLLRRLGTSHPESHLSWFSAWCAFSLM